MLALIKSSFTSLNIMDSSVADPGFDLRGGVDFVNGGWGWG